MAKNFTDLFRENPKINGKSHTNAPYPPFNDEKINESEFEHENRCKNAIYTDYGDNWADLDWTSQEYNAGEYELFKNELIRYFTFMAKKYKLNREFSISVHLHDRDGESSKVFDIDIGILEV